MPKSHAYVDLLRIAAVEASSLRFELALLHLLPKSDRRVHRTYVSDIERGARNPTATVIEKLAKPFGIPPGRLLD